MNLSLGNLLKKGDYGQISGMKKMFKYQVKSLVGVLLTGIIVLIAVKINSDFFEFPYLQSFSFENILLFWPLYAYAITTAVIDFRDQDSTKLDEKVLLWGGLTSIMAGIWEEIGYRCFYICTCMIMLMAVNWTLGTGLGWLFTLGLIAAGLIEFRNRNSIGGFLFLIGAFIIAAFTMWLNDPLYWIWEEIVLKVLHFISLGSLDSVLHGDASLLFVMGAVTANGLFREGHSYQGLYGWIHSWIAGFVLLHAMMVYGLLTAIIIHASYNMIIHLMRYIMRKKNRIFNS